MKVHNHHLACICTDLNEQELTRVAFHLLMEGRECKTMMKDLPDYPADGEPWPVVLTEGIE